MAQRTMPPESMNFPTSAIVSTKNISATLY
jgi:hypothetical protein